MITSKLQLNFGKFLFGACFGDEKVKPQLARDIIDQNGSTLLSKGYVLDDKLIQQLQQFEKNRAATRSLACGWQVMNPKIENPGRGQFRCTIRSSMPAPDSGYSR